MTLNRRSALEDILYVQEKFPRPETAIQRETVEPEPPQPHQLVMENFVAAIRDERVQLIADGVDGVYSLELCNALVLAAVERRSVSIPLDGGAFQKTLERLSAGEDELVNNSNRPTGE
jgi:predicted dehydrogenase